MKVSSSEDAIFLYVFSVNSKRGALCILEWYLV